MKVALVANTAWNLWNYRLALIQSLENEGFEVVCAAPDDAFSSRLFGSRSRYYPLFRLSRKSLSPVGNLLTLFELWRFFRRERPDTTFLFTIKPNTLGNLAAWLAGVPAISVVEGLGYPGSSEAVGRFWLRRLARLSFRLARKIVFLNADDQAEFLRLKFASSEKTAMIPGPGVDVSWFSGTATAGQNVRFLFVGRFLKEKGIRDFVEAVRILKKRNIAKAEFHLLGQPDPGNPGSINDSEPMDWEAKELIIWHRQVEDVRPVLASCDVVVLPSYYREGVPRSVLEGMAMGKIIITTDTPGCRDTVETGQNGFLVPPQSPEILAETMLNVLLLSPEKRAAMGRRSRELAFEKFDNRHVLPVFLSIVRELVGNRTALRKRGNF